MDNGNINNSNQELNRLKNKKIRKSYPICPSSKVNDYEYLEYEQFLKECDRSYYKHGCYKNIEENLPKQDISTDNLPSSYNKKTTATNNVRKIWFSSHVQFVPKKM